ncbi:helix-turn-helix transcriptional regulator [Fodinibius saliphilus]|uniref:helix-turn-helix transcriptional regulator n=1 Tax=Fodinibius saliphilus TaxID=1920650 RepID=UPI001107B179|nr:AlpA family phage regulatory protein [Fodinibius saliphilus]
MDRIIRPSELQDILGVTSSTLWRMEKEGRLPARIKISERAVGWRKSDIEEWIANRPDADITRSKTALK